MKRHALFVALLALSGLSQAVPHLLSPGVLVDPDTGLAFVANPNGYTQQIQLGEGGAVWTSREPAYPLLLADDYLIALAAAEAPGSATLLLMDPNTGRVADRVSFDLPEQVSAGFFPQPGRRFQATAVDTDDGVRLYWRHEVHALRGAVIVEPNAEGSDAINPVAVTTGAIDLVVDQGRHFAVPVRAEVSLPPQPTIALQDEERVPDVVGEQYRAADSRYALTSEAKPHDTFRQIYAWSVFDRDGKRVGRYESPYARAPFIVRNSNLILRDQPFAYAKADGRWQQRGTRLVVADLQSGRELWSVDVLDHQYRGPTPP